MKARTPAAASRLFCRKSSRAADFDTYAFSLACFSFKCATTSHVTPETDWPLAIARATPISIGYMVAT